MKREESRRFYWVSHLMALVVFRKKYHGCFLILQILIPGKCHFLYHVFFCSFQTKTSNIFWILFGKSKLSLSLWQKFTWHYCTEPLILDINSWLGHLPKFSLNESYKYGFDVKNDLIRITQTRQLGVCLNCGQWKCWIHDRYILLKMNNMKTCDLLLRDGASCRA